MRVFAIAVLIFFCVKMLQAETFVLPPDSWDNVVGELRYVTALRQDTLLDIGRDAGLGYDEIINCLLYTSPSPRDS